jgi:DNA-binding winged helix-turn-helix (wHTH) protein/TolB-like protein
MSHLYSFGRYKLDETACLLMQEGRILPVPPKALTVLMVLVQAEGRVVSKEKLLDAVWPNAFVEESNVTQQIFLLRKLLTSEGDFGEPIQTISKRGYRFTWPVERLEQAADVGEKRASGEMRAASPADPVAMESPGEIELATEVSPAPGANEAERKRRLRLRGFELAAAMIVVLAAGLVSVRVVSRHRSRLSNGGEPRVAVLAFTNMSQKPADAWLSSALREMFSTDLSAVLSLQVSPPESVEQAERDLRLTRMDGLSAQSLKQIRENLDCDEVLTGSYVVSGDELRLDTHLLDARTGKVLFNYTATRSANELLPLVEQTRAAMLPEFGRGPSAPGSQVTAEATVSQNPEAYRLYILGMEHERAFDGRAAVDLLQQSIAQDPQFALAHLELAGAYTVLGRTKLASIEAHRAEALDNHLSPEKQMKIQAGARYADHDFEGAAAIYRSLLKEHPDDLNYLRLMAANMSYAGQAVQAAAELKPVMARDANAAKDPLLYSLMSDFYGKVGDWPASLDWARKGEEISRQRRSQTMFGRLLTSETQALFHMNQLPVALERTKEALQIAREYDDDSGELRALNRMAQIETAMGDLAGARAGLEEALAKEEAIGESQREIYTLSALGAVLAKQGDPSHAMQIFTREQMLARSQNDAETLVGADLDVARQEIQTGNIRKGRADLEQVIDEAKRVGNIDTMKQAEAALGGIKGPG